MKLLPRLYTPNEGKILIDGYDIQKVELDSLRKKIGIVPQDPYYLEGQLEIIYLLQILRLAKRK